jgi:hypothetical protein
MTGKEVRMRAIEALASSGGIKDPARLIRDAGLLAEWVMAAANGDEAETPPRRAGRPPKADKGDTAPA